MGAALLTVAIWAGHFALIYGFTALACARSFAALVPWVVVPASIAAAAALAWLAIPRWRDTLTAGLAGLALIAIVWEASSLLLPSCA